MSRILTPFLTLLIAVFLMLSACSTGEQRPEIDSSKLPTVHFAGLGSKSLMLTITDNRKIDQDPKNNALVVGAVRSALTAAFERGGLKIVDKSPHRLDIQILDYTSSDADGECVKINATLKSKWGSVLMAESQACHSIHNLMLGMSLGGDLSEAYRKALSMILDYLEENQKHLIGY